MWLHSLKVAQLLRSAACLHTNQSRSYLNHLVHTHCLKLKKGVFLSIAIARHDLQQYTCLFVAALNIFTQASVKEETHATKLAVCHFVLQLNRCHLLHKLLYYQGILENVREGKSTYNGGCIMSEDSVDMGR